MSRPNWMYRVVLCGAAVAACSANLLFEPGSGSAAAQETTQQEAERERQIAERYLEILQRNPRRGTALDRAYGYYVGTGRVDELLDGYRQQTVDDPQDATAWMIVGLLESKRGQDAAAIEAFQIAQTQDPEDPFASYYLGQELALAGRIDEAVEALEEALERQPPRADLLQIFQALGRLHQRAHRHQEAIEVWNRLEAMFPNDLTVQQQIAMALAEEGQHAEALERYERLIENLGQDPSRRVQCQMQAANLKLRLGRKQEALQDLEHLLGRLNPETWLYRQVRQRIEGAFQQEWDLAGLADYYEDWIERHPEDVDAMARLAHALTGQGRAAEADKWLDRAILLAPQNTDLRLARIDRLVSEGEFREAANEFAALDQIDPNNPDNIRSWGLLILRDQTRPEAERRQEAAEVWKRLIQARPNDALTASQVADLLQQAEMADEALALYQQAIELEPENPHYREYLGQYYHSLDRQEEAMQAWRAMASGTRRNVQNLNRLVQVMASFGYHDEAVEASRQACQLAPHDFHVNLRYAELLYETERYEDSLQQLNVVAQLAENLEQREAVLARQIENYQAAGQLGEQIDRLEAELTAAADPQPSAWRQLARYQQADRRLSEATAAVSRAIELDDQSVATWRLAARIYETTGNLGEAADAHRRLATLDHSHRTQYLTELAQIEARLGRVDEALRAGRELLAVAPGNPRHYNFFANLCFQLGRVDDGLEALRRAVRANPTDLDHLLALAQALAGQFMTAESIELYWQAFERASDIQTKISIVSQLSDLSVQAGQFDRVLERLERMRRQGDRHREITLCIAQVHLQAEDYATGRAELERLLVENDRDAQLLQQLASLAQQEGDVEGALRYQRQLSQIAPDRQNQHRLAELYLEAGEPEEAEALWTQLILEQDEPHRVIRSIERLLGYSRYETVLSLTGRLLQQQPQNWELLYLEGVALEASRQQQEAASRFQRILDIHLPHDEKNAEGMAQAQRRTGHASRVSGTLASQTQTSPMMNLVNRSHHIRRAAGLEVDPYGGATYGTGGGSQIWTPDDFGQARMAAIAWLWKLASQEEREKQLLAELEPSDKGPARDQFRALWDLVYLHLIRSSPGELYEAAKRLSHEGTAEAHWIYLYSLNGRTGQRRAVGPGSAIHDDTPPLDPEEMDHVLQCYHSLWAQQPDVVDTTVVYSVTDELKRSGRLDEEQELYSQALDSAEHRAALTALVPMAVERADIDGTLRIMEKLAHLDLHGSATSPLQNVVHPLSRAVHQWAEQEQYDAILRLVDHYTTLAHEQQTAAAQLRQGRRRTSQQTWYQIYSARGTQRIQLEFPSPNSHYDHGAIQLLRNAFEIYKQNERMDELTGHFERRAELAEGHAKVLALLGLSYLQWWNEDPHAAAKNLQQATELATEDLALRFDLASVQSDPVEALAVLESIPAWEQRSLLEREQAILQLAIQSGAVDRARQAAERLFGLRLDGNEQLALAQAMHQLGLHELAEAVLDRARHGRRGQPARLVQIMQQYQQRNQMEEAVQVAHQILRQSSSVNRQPGQFDQARSQAIQVLARSGELAELIQRTEVQLERSPRNAQMLRSLAEYYQAAGQSEQALATYDRLAELNPHDAQLRYEIGQMLIQSGDRENGLRHYRQALEAEPTLFARYASQFQSEFRRADQLGELANLLLEADLSTLGQPHQIFNLTQQLIHQDETREQGMALVDRIWEAIPQYRQSVLSFFRGDELTAQPRVYQYLREATLSEDQRRGGPWRIVQNSWISQLLDAAEKQDKLGELYEEIWQKLENDPDWLGAEALLALIELRRGILPEGRARLRRLLAEKETPLPLHAAQLIGRKLEQHEQLRPLVIQMYEQVLEQHLESPSWGYNSGVARNLVELYVQEDRQKEAHAVLLKFASRPPNDHHFAYDLASQQRQQIAELQSIADRLASLDFPMDALRVYRQIELDPQSMQSMGSSQALNRSLVQMVEQVQQKMAEVQNALTPDVVLSELDSIAIAGPPDSPVESERPANALMLFVESKELDQMTISSPFTAALRKAAEDSELELFQQAQVTLRRLVDEHPQDFAIMTLAALVEIAGATPQSQEEAVQRLIQLADEHPLEPLDEPARANAAQQREATEQLPIWLVAREMLLDENLREAGEPLAARALEAAQRQLDPTFHRAMLRELGQQALDQGDRARAEQHWRQLLATLRGRKTTPLQVDEFQQVMRLAHVALDNELPELSLDCVEQALQAGSPLDRSGSQRSAAMGGGGVVYSLGGIVSTGSGAVVTRSPGANQLTTDHVVEQSVAEMVRLWEQHQVPAEQVYETLAVIVLPELRPNEIFLYPRPLLSEQNTVSTQSVAGLLVQCAVEAQRTEDLRKHLVTRQQHPLAELPGHLLEVQLAVASGDDRRAGEALDWFARRLERDSLQNTSYMASRAALSSLQERVASGKAVEVLDRIMTNLSRQADDPLPGALRTHLARGAFESGQIDTGTRHLLDHVETLRQSPISDRGNQQAYQQTVLEVAAQLARVGMLDEALTVLGDLMDGMGTEMLEQSSSLIAPILQQAAALPPAKRYELLKDWILPTDQRPAVRQVAGFIPYASPPPVFTNRPATNQLAPVAELVGGSESQRDSASRSNHRMISLTELLIDAARQEGKLEQLADQVQRAVDQEAAGADDLRLLVQIALDPNDNCRAEIEQLLTQVIQNLPEENQRDPIPWSHYLVSRACLQSDEFYDLGERLNRVLISYAQRTRNRPFNAHLSHDLHRSRLSRQGIQDPGSEQRSPLEYWQPSTLPTAEGLRTGVPPAWWTAAQGYVVHVTGSEHDLLYFRYPLTGTFEFSVDAYSAPWGEAAAAYGGLVFEALHFGNNTAIHTVAQNARLPRPNPAQLRFRYNRLTIRVEPERVTYLCNGHVVWENTNPSPTSPWVALQTQAERHTAWYNVTISGEPKIPQELYLIDGDRMEGWSARHFREAIPGEVGSVRSAGAARQPDYSIDPFASVVREFDWLAKDGVLHGPRLTDRTAQDPIQSWLAYHRPLHAGEEISYEFFFRPGQIMVHPALGRIALLLELDGVRLHWITDDPDAGWSELPVDNQVAVADEQRGPEHLPLRIDDWNSLQMVLDDDILRLRLNDVEIYERRLEDANSRQFGLFRYKNRTAAQVRNIVLTGDWPETLSAEILENLTLASDGQDESRRLRAALVEESFFARNADHVLRQARRLDVHERFAFLKEWVLPSDMPGMVRLYGDFSPMDPAPPVDQPDEGGSLRSPALELVQVAAELGRLDELAERVDNLSTDNDVHNQRGQLALLALIRLTQQRNDEAARLLEELHAMLFALPLDIPVWQRWPELTAAHVALTRSEAVGLTHDLLEEMMRQVRAIAVQDIPVWKIWPWERRIRHAYGQARIAQLAQAGEVKMDIEPAWKFWDSTVHVTAETRGEGFPDATWVQEGEVVRHYPGHEQDYLYLRIPLRGNFEVQCELTSFGWREAKIAYAGHCIQLHHQLNHFILWQHNRRLREFPLDPPLEDLGDWYSYRLVVQDRIMKVFINDRQIYQADLPEGHDPWLAMQARNTSTSGVRNLKILGTPEIPEVVELSGPAHFPHWLADYYEQTTSGELADWSHLGETFVGRRRSDLNQHNERLLRYHRPIVEDGQIEYEFYYEPGRVAVHPALDRLALLLDPEGVQVHWLTDGKFDRTGLAADNLQTEAANRRGEELPLKSNAWNHVQLVFEGRQLALRLNDQPVYERELEPTNRRFFGLFHYADQTQARVRNVRYQGSWPRQLPDREELFAR